MPEWLLTLPKLHSLALGKNLFVTGDAPPAFTFNYPELTTVDEQQATVSTATTDILHLPPNTSPATYTPPPSVFLESFVRLSNLKRLKLDSLGIAGGFPASWEFRMVNLTKLDLSNNLMQGQIPGYLNTFSGLETLLLDRNEFGGAIPTLDNLRSLAVLDLSFNQLSGPLPTWGAGLNLTILNLSHNLLSGSLPYDNQHNWRSCSVAHNYFMCTKGPEQMLNNMWKTKCRATCSDTQQLVPLVRPPIDTLTGRKGHRNRNTASSLAGQRWMLPLGLAVLLPLLVMEIC
ncbi:hypothetical protein BGZ94_009251 [Podila epigama]|nr:hypothetical protein BGZ94_009251 [Podila epigama]